MEGATDYKPVKKKKELANIIALEAYLDEIISNIADDSKYNGTFDSRHTLELLMSIAKTLIEIAKK